MAVLYPDRVNAVIAADGAPVKQADGKFHPYYNLFWKIIRFMIVLEIVNERQGLSRNDAKKMIKQTFSENRAIAAILMR